MPKWERCPAVLAARRPSAFPDNTVALAGDWDVRTLAAMRGRASGDEDHGSRLRCTELQGLFDTGDGSRQRQEAGGSGAFSQGDQLFHGGE